MPLTSAKMHLVPVVLGHTARMPQVWENSSATVLVWADRERLGGGG